LDYLFDDFQLATVRSTLNDISCGAL